MEEQDPNLLNTNVLELDGQLIAPEERDEITRRKVLQEYNHFIRLKEARIIWIRTANDAGFDGEYGDYQDLVLRDEDTEEDMYPLSDMLDLALSE